MQWAEEIGAAYAPDANSAVTVIKSLLVATK
jgi:methanogenic corrinoid protein MtbC1